MKETIFYGFGDSFLGLVLLARSEKGICALLIGDDRQALKDALKERFALAEIVEEPYSKSFVFNNGQDIDLRGSPFQLKVWNALREVSKGETKTYSEIAKKISSPKAIRAVANACAANPIAVIIPCHRIIRKDGSLGGYRWGIERKKQLLQKEAYLTHLTQ